MGAARVLVPLIILGGGAGVTGWIILRARKAKASPLEEKPQLPTGPVSPGDPAVQTYNIAMSDETRDLDYLKEAADFLERSGKPRWAREVRQKRDSLMAATGAAMSQARADVAKQAATPETELAKGRAEWEQAAGGAPTQKDVDAMYVWAMKPESVDKAIVQQAYQMVIAYDKGPDRVQRIARLGDKLAKLKAGTYGVGKALPETPAVQIPDATEEPDDIIPSKRDQEVVVRAGGAETPIPEPEEEDEEPEGRALPPLPPEPSPSPPAAQPSTAATPDVPELAKEESSAAADPNGTISLARALIEVEGESGWKKKLAGMVKAWQGQVGLGDDGKFGVGSALKMAEEVGVLPLIRYWPKGSASKSSAVEEYRSKLHTLAFRLDREGKKEHAAAIRASADHERGQGWPSTPGPVTSAGGGPGRLDMLDKLFTTLSQGGEE